MTEHTDWFVRCQHTPAEAPLRLFAFPFAGGGTAIYRQWGERLRRTNVYSALLPGRERRLGEPPIGDMSLLIDRMLPAFLSLADRPFVLFGHSMGALIAYELAIRLRAHDMCPRHLIVSAYRSPECPKRRVLHPLPDTEFVDELRGYGGTEANVLAQPELMEILLPMIRADFRLHETYVFTNRPPLNCPVTAIVATRDQHVAEDEMTAWADKTDRSFALMRVDGSHFYISESPDSALAIVQDCIDGLTSH